ncbi:hypothetical protein MN608_08420 [Microdochium nivale]|nr:hypothetical protein MN608_08420 [Microdochium nivale]
MLGSHATDSQGYSNPDRAFPTLKTLGIHEKLLGQDSFAPYMDSCTSKNGLSCTQATSTLSIPHPGILATKALLPSRHISAADTSCVCLSSLRPGSGCVYLVCVYDGLAMQGQGFQQRTSATHVCPLVKNPAVVPALQIPKNRSGRAVDGNDDGDDDDDDDEKSA